MTQLIKYEAACRAIAECKAIDEVKGLADKAAAMQAYGRMANDRTLEVDAAEIRIRAERRLGEMLTAQKADDGLNRGAASMAGNQHTGKLVRSSETTAPKLADAGISKDLSSRAQKLAAVPEAEFEAELAAKRERDKQDGARVSARLEKAGEKALKAKPDHIPADEGPSEDEIREAEKSAADDVERVRLILESDDVVASLTAKCAQQAALIRVLEGRVGGLQNEVAEHVRSIKRLKSQIAKAGVTA